MLASLGAFLNRHIRATDHAFRIGGDEFAVVMPHTDMDGGLVVAHQMLGMALEPAAGAMHADAVHPSAAHMGAVGSGVARTGAVPGGAAFARPVSFSAGVSAVPARVSTSTVARATDRNLRMGARPPFRQPG